MIIRTFGEYLLKVEDAQADVVCVDGHEADSYSHDNIRLKDVIENAYFKQEIKQIIFDEDGEIREEFLDLNEFILDESAGTCIIYLDEGGEEYYTVKLDSVIEINKDSIEVEESDSEEDITVSFYKRQLALVHPF
jgi:hypothetical protein